MLAIFGKGASFLKPDDVYILPIPDRRSLYSYLARLRDQGLPADDLVALALDESLNALEHVLQCAGTVDRKM